MPRSSKNSEYMSNGISISPSVPSTGDKVKLVYDGILAKNGASHVYAHIGFGNRWDNQGYYRMERSNTGFETTIPVANSSDTMNLCFKDCANNWDNNSGRNYSFDIVQ